MPVFRATLKRGYFKAQAELPPIDYVYIHFYPCKVLPISPIVVAWMGCQDCMLFMPMKCCCICQGTQPLLSI